MIDFVDKARINIITIIIFCGPFLSINYQFSFRVIQ